PLVPSMPRLEMVQCFFAGADRFDFGKMPPDVTVATASGALATAVSEHAFSLLLSLCRDLDLHRRRLDEGVFEQLDPLNRELFGKSIGIVGYGPIGQRIGRIAKAFGMRTLALNTSGKSDADATYTLEGLDRMLKESDYVVICIPLNRHTDGLIGKDMLSLMKENAILVNVSRGKVLVEKDLYEHLRDHPSFKAGLDVWWHYPRDGETWSQDYDFGKLPNIAMTPHNAALVPGWRERTIVFCCRNMLDHMNGKKIRNKVRREDYLI
ncbi:MAG TPA: 2-hydroxyacid dehydrogenase, partial [Candidatus Methanofastidiosa archaeon]|nr:2-hydroxyacid dehydrogenase [Candidatus Methanofastidiosa archaeon]